MVLIAIGVFLSLAKIYREDVSFLTLTFDHPMSQLVSWKTGELLSGEKIVGQFTAQDGYLGIVAVRFDNLLRINDDGVIFRIREKDASRWYYQNKYKVDQFQPHQLFPFGFPIITKSSQKEYIFEVESVFGVPGNSISLDPAYPVFSTRYKYPRDQILGELDELDAFLPKKLTSLKTDEQDLAIQIKTLVGFLQKKATNFGKAQSQQSLFVKYFLRKVENIFINVKLSRSVVFYFLPLFVYQYWLWVHSHVKRKIYFPVLFPLLVTILEIFYLPTSDDFVTLETIIFWIMIVRHYQLKTSILIGLASVFLIASPILLELNQAIFAEKTGAWAFLLLFIGVLFVIVNYKISLRQETSVKRLTYHLISEMKKIIRLLFQIFHPKKSLLSTNH